MSMKGGEMEFNVIDAAGVLWQMLGTTSVPQPHRSLAEQPESLWAPAGAHNSRLMEAKETPKQPSVFEAARGVKEEKP